jgi:hypothetical protein
MTAAEIIRLIEEREKEWRAAADRIGIGNTDADSGWSWEVCLAKAIELSRLLEMIGDAGGADEPSQSG